MDAKTNKSGYHIFVFAYKKHSSNVVILYANKVFGVFLSHRCFSRLFFVKSLSVHRLSILEFVLSMFDIWKVRQGEISICRKFHRHGDTTATKVNCPGDKRDSLRNRDTMFQSEGYSNWRVLVTNR